MKTNRRLILLVAGLAMLVGSRLAWADSTAAAVNFATIMTGITAKIFGSTVKIDYSFLSSITLSAVIVVAGLVLMVSAVTGSRELCVVGSLIALISIIAWFNYIGYNPVQIVENFTKLGSGFKFSLCGTAAGLAISVMSHPKPEL